MIEFAQASVEANPLAAYGLSGIVIAWLFWFFDKLRQEIKLLAHRIDGLTRAMLMDLMSRDSTGPHARELARQELDKIEARTQRGHE
jgi:hypothetical protein